MKYNVHHVVVIGAGTMGGGIAALLANAGVRVTLLDIVPNKLTPEEEKQGLTLDDPAVRNRIVKEGFDQDSEVASRQLLHSGSCSSGENREPGR